MPSDILLRDERIQVIGDGGSTDLEIKAGENSDPNIELNASSARLALGGGSYEYAGGQSSGWIDLFDEAGDQRVTMAADPGGRLFPDHSTVHVDGSEPSITVDGGDGDLARAQLTDGKLTLNTGDGESELGGRYLSLVGVDRARADIDGGRLLLSSGGIVDDDGHTVIDDGTVSLGGNNEADGAIEIEQRGGATSAQLTADGQLTLGTHDTGGRILLRDKIENGKDETKIGKYEFLVKTVGNRLKILKSGPRDNSSNNNGNSDNKGKNLVPMLEIDADAETVKARVGGSFRAIQLEDP